MNLKLIKAFAFTLFFLSLSSRIHHRHDNYRRSKHDRKKASKHTHRFLQTAPTNTTSPTNINNLNTTANQAIVGTTKCNSEAVKALGLKGTGQFTNKVFLDACGTSTESCCTLDDQTAMVRFWTTNGIERNLQDRIDFHNKVVTDLFDQAVAVQKRASYMLATSSPSYECLLMANRLKSYRIDETLPLIKRNYERMQLFMQTSYRGIFCAACDPKANAFIASDKKQVILSSGFCRNLIANSLNALLYSHVHTPILSTLMTSFLGKCTTSGKFNRKAELPPEVLQISAMSGDLDKCKKTRNKVFWMTSCVPICKKFAVGKFDEFFEPALKSYIDVTKRYSVLIKQFDESAKPVVTVATAGTAGATAKPQTAATGGTPAPGGATTTGGAPSTGVTPAPGVAPATGGATTTPPSTTVTSPATVPPARRLKWRHRVLAENSTPTNPPSNQVDPKSAVVTPNPSVAAVPTAGPSAVISTDGSDASLTRFAARELFVVNGTAFGIVEYSTDIRMNGLDPYYFGLYANLTDSAVNSGKAVEKVDKAVQKNRRSRRLSSASVLKGLAVAVLAFAFGV